MYVDVRRLAGINADIFGSLRVGQQNLKIDVQFYRDVPSKLCTVTTSNNGSAASSVGGALFSTSATNGGTAKGVSFSNIVYHGGSEVFAYFTAMWPTPGIANSYQRIGPYDASNGAFVGYEGTSFGVTYRNNGSDTTVAKASFSEDTLTGAASSRFRRANVPEAIDLTKLNVFRIRMGWVGGAPIAYEVLSPDGEWVTFHVLRFPNTATGPSIRSADLPMTIEVNKTAGAGTDLSILTGCWAAGTTYQQADQTIIGQGSQTALGQNVCLDVAGSGPLDVMNYRSIALSIVPSSGTVTAGAITFEASNDAVNWVSFPLFDVEATRAIPVTSYTLAASTNRHFIGNLTHRYFRARISTGITGTNTGISATSHLRTVGLDIASIGIQTNPIPVSVPIKSVTASFTRPSDTTQYVTGDVVCNSTSAPTVLTFSGMANSNGLGGVIQSATLYLGSNPTTKPTWDLFLFDTAPTIDNDNSPFTPTDAEILNCVGVITFGAPIIGDVSGTGTNMVYQSAPMLSYVCAAANTALYGVLVARNTITPTSADTYNIRLVTAPA
jgi:hypothetical protein